MKVGQVFHQLHIPVRTVQDPAKYRLGTPPTDLLTPPDRDVAREAPTPAPEASTRSTTTTFSGSIGASGGEQAKAIKLTEGQFKIDVSKTTLKNRSRTNTMVVRPKYYGRRTAERPVSAAGLSADPAVAQDRLDVGEIRVRRRG